MNTNTHTQSKAKANANANAIRESIEKLFIVALCTVSFFSGLAALLFV